MPTTTIRIAALALGLLSFGAQAQELPGFSFIEACRIDGTNAVLRIVYQGSSCETTTGLEPRVELDGTGALVFVATIPSDSTCTAELVPNYVQHTIGVASDTSELDVTVLTTDYEAQGREVVKVLTDGVDCAAEGEAF